MKKKPTDKLLLPKKTDEELKQIAQDLWAGKIFSDRHMNKPEDVYMVFMALAFMTEKQLKELEKEEVNFFYEYLSAATPTGVNGMPTFFSVRMLRKKETERMFEYYKAIEEAMKNVEIPKEKK